MNAALAKVAVVPRGLVTVALLAAAATALVTVCAMVGWMILHPRRAPARG